MKLESLKSSKFEAFKNNELLDTINIVGGRHLKTLHHGNADCLRDETKSDVHFNDGSSYDYCGYLVPAAEPMEEEQFELAIAANSCCELQPGDVMLLQYCVSF